MCNHMNSINNCMQYHSVWGLYVYLSSSLIFRERYFYWTAHITLFFSIAAFQMSVGENCDNAYVCISSGEM